MRDDEEQPWREAVDAAAGLLRRIPSGLRRGLTFGGGSALALAFGHRRSFDIDLFHTDAQVLSFVSPRFDDDLDAAFPDAVEAANFVKFPLRGQEVDIIVAPRVTPARPERSVTFLDVVVDVEAPAEILAKKILYRGAEARARDLFDLAAAAQALPDAIEVAGEACGRAAVGRLCARAERLASRMPELLAVAVSPSREWRDFVTHIPALLEEALDRLERAARRARRDPPSGPRP